MSRIREVVEGIEGAVLIGLNLALGPVLRRGRIRWGATDDEVRRVLPGDELVPHPKWSYTYAITVRATAAEVWPWLAQMGQGRGGFYSYESLENLVGCDIHNADRILAEFQNLQVGDGVKLAAKMPGFPVVIIEPGRAIVLHADTRIGGSPIPASKKPGDYFATTWAFFLDDEGSGATRLLARFKSDYNETLANRLIYGTLLVEPVSCVMQRKMLLGIKRRVEAGR